MAQNSQHAKRNICRKPIFLFIVASKQKIATRESMTYKTLFLLAESLISKGNYIGYHNI